MTLHPLQGPVDRLVDYLADARYLYKIVDDLTNTLVSDRKARGNATGGGGPPAEHKTLNRAVVVAAVGAMEAFFEDLTLTAIDYRPSLKPPEPNWFSVATKGAQAGMVQTPSPYNVRKMLWAYFQYDPMHDWDIVVSASPAELGTGSTWRVAQPQFAGSDAADFLTAMVKVRHGFAHQDHAQKPPHRAGIVTLTSGGKVAVHSHHAHNSMSALVQIAIQSAMGLDVALGIGQQWRWSTSMTRARWDHLIARTPAAKSIKSSWKAQPF